MTLADTRTATETILRALACGVPRCPCALAERRGRGRTHCPVHADNTPSLNVEYKGDNLLAYCHGSCGQQAVIDALRERGLWPEQAKYGERQELFKYDYTDAEGHLLFQVVRYFPKDFRQRRPTGHNQWEWNLDGVVRTLYKLPELIAAPNDKLRFIVEGEKDVDRLGALDLVATCNVGGAGKWRSEYNRYFRDTDVVLVVDNDDAGRNHANAVANHLKGIARTIRYLELPDLDEHGDISDWLDDGGTRAKLHLLALNAPHVGQTSTPGESSMLLDSDAVKVVLNGPTGLMEFVFSDMEKLNRRELETEMSIQLLQPGTVADAYTTRLNILSASGREIVRREVQEILNLPKDQCAKMLNRAYDEARSVFLNQDRTQIIRHINAPLRLEYMVDELLLQERPTILFGPGGSLKTYVTMSLMLAIARGEDWLGRRTKRCNVLLIDYETGPGTTHLRLRRLANAHGLEEVPENMFMFNAGGLPLDDLVEPLKRTIAQHEIGFIGLDHCAAAAGTEPEKAEAALRFYRAMGKLKTPAVCIAHVTGDVASNPEVAKRPFGSIFWDNGCGLSWFMSKEEQDEGSPNATIGLFQKKWNDTGRLRDFSVQVAFDGDGGPIDVDRADLRSSAQLLALRGQKDVVHLALGQPMTVDQLHDTTGIGPASLRKILRRYPGLFEQVTTLGGSSHAILWQRTEISNRNGENLRRDNETTLNTEILVSTEGLEAPLAGSTDSVRQDESVSPTEPIPLNNYRQPPSDDLPW